MTKAKETIGNLKDIATSLGEVSKNLQKFATVAKLWKMWVNLPQFSE